MGISLDQIKAPIAAELDLFEIRFRQAMQSNVPILNHIMTYIVKRKGKQVRPMFVLFSASFCNKITDSTLRGAALVELLHTATLVHDDVVDESMERRGFFSVYALWKAKLSVLVGDYLLSKGLLISIDNEEFALLKIISESVRQMSEGELLQIEKARRLDITEEIYFDIIRKKTASLIASCCAIGASSAGAGPEVVEKMRLFGEKIGIAFQIKDDLFDFGNGDIGKPTGIDIKEKKMTLPLIYALNNTSYLNRRRIIYIIRNQNKNNKKVREVVDFVAASGGLEYAREYMQKYRDEALQILASMQLNSSSSLEQLVNYVIERKK
jgi:octaprenyl-diphosphate synthase